MTVQIVRGVNEGAGGPAEHLRHFVFVLHVDRTGHHVVLLPQFAGLFKVRRDQIDVLLSETPGGFGETVAVESFDCNQLQRRPAVRVIPPALPVGFARFAGGEAVVALQILFRREQGGFRLFRRREAGPERKQRGGGKYR